MQVIVNGETRTIQPGATVASVLETLNLPNPKAVGVEVNGEFVEHEAFASRTLHENDAVEVLQFLGGG